MQTIDLASVPDFIKKGTLFPLLIGGTSSDGNVNGDDDDVPGVPVPVTESTTLSFPANNCQFDLSRLHELNDASKLLSTLRYWGVNEIPVELLVYLLESPMSPDTMSLFAEEHREGDSFAFLVDLSGLRSMHGLYQRMEYAVGLGYVFLLSALHECCCARNKVQLSRCKLSQKAVKGGRLDCLSYLFVQGYVLDSNIHVLLQQRVVTCIACSMRMSTSVDGVMVPVIKLLWAVT
jgi:hypothetical protein